MAQYWWVNQSETYEHEWRLGCLAAPLTARDGSYVAGYDAMRFLQPDDVILHYAEHAVRRLGRVTAAAERGRRPYPLERLSPHVADWVAHVTSEPLPRPIALERIPRDLRAREAPFDHAGNPKRRGYLFPLSAGFVEHLVNTLGLPSSP